MTFKKSAEPIRVLLYALFAAALLFLRFVGDNGEPLGLALVYALGYAGLSPYIAAVCYACTAFVFFQWRQFFLYVLQSVLLCVGFLIQARLRKTNARAHFLPPLIALALGLVFFAAFAPFTPYLLPFRLTLPTIAQRVLIAAAVFLSAAVFSVGIRTLLQKCLQCRLRSEELVFCILFFVLTGVGLCRFLGINAYLGAAFFILLTFSCVTKDATALVCAFTLSLPPLLAFGVSPERFFLYGIVLTLFQKSGRLAGACAFLAVFFAYGYVDGIYTLETSALVQSVLSALLPVLLFILLPAPLIRELENRLVYYREKHLSRIAINRNRAAIGQQLFELSSVFREIQATFAALGTTEAEEGAKEYIRTCVVESVCKTCPQYRACQRKKVFTELSKVIDVGCLKGKTNLIDLPRSVADVCVNQNGILRAVNRQIGEYKRYMTETENAAAGRNLLAGQAQGVSEILKNLALEQSEPLRIYTDKERRFNNALLRAGIVCSEVLVYGSEEDITLSLITYGKADVKTIAAVATELFGETMTISKRLTLGADKYCCILHKRPRFDAAFGVATVKKAGEAASGDSHSVIKIDERRFLVVLSDGMGSGEYARRISESTVSLLESFYRAKMPADSVLSSINKLLTFSKEETFACVDIAVVDLDSGRADIVKIGSPMGFILSDNTVKVLESGSLPLGILDSLRPDSATYGLGENDILLFLSDGITDAFGSATDLYDALKSIPIHNPQQLADLLLDSALKAYGGVAKDDMTAVAVRLFKAA